MTVYTHHGYQFEIHTADWTDEAGAEMAKMFLRGWLMGLDKFMTADVHNAAAAWQEGEEDGEFIDVISDAEADAVCYATKDLGPIPDNGQSVTLRAL